MKGISAEAAQYLRLWALGIWLIIILLSSQDGELLKYLFNKSMTLRAGVLLALFLRKVHR